MLHYSITDLLIFFYCLISTQSCGVFIDSLSMTTEKTFVKCLSKIYVQLHKNKPLQENTVPAFFLDIYRRKKKKSSLNCEKFIICCIFCSKLVIFDLVFTPTLYLGKIYLQLEKQRLKQPRTHHYCSQQCTLLSSLHFLVCNSCFIRVKLTDLNLNTNFLTN